MNKSTKLSTAGHYGMVGSAPPRQMLTTGLHDIVTCAPSVPKLLNKAALHHSIHSEQPEHVFFAAANVENVNVSSEGDFEMDAASPRLERARCLVGEVTVNVDPHFCRPPEVDKLLSDPINMLARFGWKAKLTRPKLVESVYQAAKHDGFVQSASFQAYTHNE